MTFAVRRSLGGFARPRSLTAAIAQSCYGVTFYPVKTIAPFGLMPFHPTPSRLGLDDPQFLLPAAGVAVLSSALFLLRRDRPGLLAAWVSYLVLLAPSSGLVPTGPMFIADRYSYLASMSGFVLASAGFASLQSWGRRRRVGLGVAVVSLGLVASLIPLTWRQRRARGATPMPPGNTRRTAWPRRSRPTRLQRKPTTAWACADTIVSTDEAVHEFRSAIRQDQGFAQARGVPWDRALADSGQSDNAIGALAEAARTRSVFSPISAAASPWSWSNGGRLDEAYPNTSRQSKREPDNTDWHVGLGVILYRQGRLDEAATELSEAVRLDPDNPMTRDYFRRIREARGVR